MALLAARDLGRFLDAAPSWRDRVLDGIRLIFDGTTITLASADHPDLVLASETSVGRPVTGPWEVTAHAASLQTIKAWTRSVHPELMVGICPFWGGGDLRIVFTSEVTGNMAFPVIACPTAPASVPGGGA